MEQRGAESLNNKLTMTLEGDGVGIFDQLHMENNAEGTLPSGTRKHAIGGIAITKVHSTFPVALGINLEGVSTDQNNQFTSQGRRFNYVAYPGESKDLHYEIVHRREKADKFCQNFPGWNSDNLHRGILDLSQLSAGTAVSEAGLDPNTQMCLVNEQNPVAKVYMYMLAEMDRQGLHVEPVKKMHGALPIPKSKVDACKAIVIEGLEKKVRLVDASQIKLSVRRAITSSRPQGGSLGSEYNKDWTDTVEIATSKDMNPQALKTRMEMDNKLYVTLRILFKVV